MHDEQRGSLLTRHVTATSTLLTSLRPNTVYAIKIRAYTSAGGGPWSAVFRARTFRAPVPGSREPSFVWSSREGLLQTNTMADNTDMLIHADTLKV